VGPHRADWSLELRRPAGREALSRGQTKLTALVLLLAQAALAQRMRANGRCCSWMTWRRNWIANHQQRVLELLAGQPVHRSS
jgi:DNA replication and repair protein RecF